MIHLENIHKTYNLGTPNALHVLKGIDLHINIATCVTPTDRIRDAPNPPRVA